MKKGFTLIELLIVVAIIGVLSSVVLLGLGPVQRQGRDARRLSDLREVQNALELYNNKLSSYPDMNSADQTDVGTWTALSNAIGAANLGVSVPLPNDPKSRNAAPISYMYGVLAPGLDQYVIAAQLEDPTNPNLTNSATAVTLGVGWPGWVAQCGVVGVPPTPTFFCIHL